MEKFQNISTDSMSVSNKFHRFPGIHAKPKPLDSIAVDNVTKRAVMCMPSRHRRALAATISLVISAAVFSRSTGARLRASAFSTATLLMLNTDVTPSSYA